eukprot:g10969.t1
MPDLAFSLGPLNPSQKQQQQEHGGEKENASSPPTPMSGGGICKKTPGELSSGGRTSAGSVGRLPLEDVSASAPTAAAASTGGSAVVCKRDSSCKCPDCDMAASVFGIDELRQVGGGARVPTSPDAAAFSPPPAGGGGLARSPVPGSIRVQDTAPSSPLVDEAPHTVENSEDVTAQQEAVVAAAADDSRKVDMHEEEPPQAALAARVAASPTPAATPSSLPAEATAEVPSAAAEVVPTQRPSAAGGKGEGKDSHVVGEQQPAHNAGEEKEGAPRQVTGGGTPAQTHGSSASAENGGGGKKKAGWGFRMARAVFSPRSPKDKQGGGGGGGDESSGTTTTAFAGELEDEATAAASAAVAASAAASPQQPFEEATTTAEPSVGDDIPAPTGDDIGRLAGEDDLLSDDGLGNGEGEEEHGPVDQEEGDAAAAAVSGGTCKPPFPGGGNKSEVGVGLAEKAAATGPAGPDGVLGKGAASKKRSSSGRRLSKDVFFECSSEVDHVLASDSESDFDDDDNGHRGKQEIPPSADAPAATGDSNTVDGASSSAPEQAPFTPAAAAAVGGTRSRRTSACSPVSLLPVVEANSPAAALEAAVAAAAAGAGAETRTAAAVAGGAAAVAAGDEAKGSLAEAAAATAAAAAAVPTEPPSGAAPYPEAAQAPPSSENAPPSHVDDDSQPQGGGARGFLGLGRRRNRRHGAQLELGMADAYGHEDHRAKFSQAEVDAKIKERLSEEKAAFEKTVSAMKADHEAELQAAAAKLQQSSSDGNRAKIAARDAEALEREIAMLSERYGEAAAAAKTTGKTLREKEALLDACTAQLMGLKTDLAAARADHAAEKQAIKEAADAERRSRSAAEGSLQQLEMAYNKLEDSEREKRAAGILKMKHDMQALARAQFAEANKQHVALKARLERSEANTRMLQEAAKEKDLQVKEAVRKADELQCQVDALQKAQAESAADASRREQILQEEANALREEAESRLDELEAMARERDSANNGRDVSQDALARMAIRNTQMKESVADLEGKVKELEGFCTEALDELDAEKAKNAQLLLAASENAGPLVVATMMAIPPESTRPMGLGYAVTLAATRIPHGDLQPTPEACQAMCDLLLWGIHHSFSENPQTLWMYFGLRQKEPWASQVTAATRQLLSCRAFMAHSAVVDRRIHPMLWAGAMIQSSPENAYRFILARSVYPATDLYEAAQFALDPVMLKHAERTAMTIAQRAVSFLKTEQARGVVGLAEHMNNVKVALNAPSVRSKMGMGIIDLILREPGVPLVCSEIPIIRRNN